MSADCRLDVYAVTCIKWKISLNGRVKLRRGLYALGIVAIAAVIGLATATASAEMSPAKQRQAAMKAMGGHMKALGAVAKGKVAYSAAIPVHAQAIHELGTYMGLLFPAGSGGEETRLKADIWTDRAGLSARLDAFADSTPALVAAAKTGNAGAIRAAMGGVGKKCVGCHKAYRKPKKK